MKAVVVACNTSTAIALGELRRRFDLPILGVIRPGATSAALASRNRFFLCIESTDTRFDREATAKFLSELSPKGVSEVAQE